MKKLGDTLRELREDHDMTQEQVATLLGTNQGYYSKYELNKIEPSLDRLKKLCVLYNVSADYLLALPKNLKWPR